ncbi:MAG: hypothetical protein IJV55_00515, partial [Paludibacteraceae bacterium]|nr:hypothetical protein [Paludibacteraceae bacterium]
MQTDNDIEKRKTDGRNGIIFFLPFAYYFSIRLKTVPKLLSWLLLYLFPTGWYAYLCAGGFSLHFVLTYLLLLIAVFTLYETGYIHNDTYATRRETEPTLRLDEASQTFFYHHAGQIFGSRACIALLALTGFFLLNGRSAASWCTVASVMAVPVLFYAY